ncbi:uncharacterized protein LOC133178718 [Saccostrea echinata]|uniref:uncharacterized protein LOC133178718 n=1 Tax=Saccostrea echinata TaxID=191078 RepID=UPI002A818D77|nr:uncharacterized protein LOC133178718 [Saccostrea echinata]
MTRSDDMSVDKCRMLCTKLNNKFYGVEGSQYCFCGDTLMKPIKKHWRECNQRCIGNKRQWCGGHWKMHIYSNTGYLGCFQDQKNRVLTGKYTHSSRMTVHGCRYMCGREFYQYYGVEGARYCFCGNTLTTSVRKPERECNQKCTGSKWQRCGGHWKMNIYKNVFVDVTG